jgi:hypothetical protein
MIGLRATPELRKAIEDWAEKQDDPAGLSEAIRRLVELGLASAQPSRPLSRKAAAKSFALAGEQIDRLQHGKVATPEQQESRKRRLLKGPKEFREMRAPKAKD